MPLPRVPAIRTLVVLALSALCGCQPPPPIKVGFVGGFTGRMSDLAIDGRNGAQLAIDTLNAQGGAVRYELRVIDHPPDTSAARAVVDAAVREGDAFAIGPMTSEMAIEMAKEANLRQFVLITPTANSDALSGQDDYFFRVIAAAAQGAQELAAATVGRGYQRAAVLMEWHNRAYSEGFGVAFGRKFEALGGQPVHYAHFQSDATPDFAAAAAEVLASHPQIVLMVCSAVDASIAAQQLRRLDPNVRIALASWAANVPLLQMGGRALEGALVLQALDLDSKAPDYLDFKRRYMTRFGVEPNHAAVYAYEAAFIGAEGLKRRGPGQSLRDVLRIPGAWPGLQAPVVLDRYGDSTNPYHLSEIRDGRFVMVPP
jgi:branched-chain amino acid transport system substrate-binding protein